MEIFLLGHLSSLIQLFQQAGWGWEFCRWPFARNGISGWKGSDSLGSTSYQPVVMDPSKTSGRHSPSSNPSRPSLLVRRIRSGVGRLLGHRDCFRPLVPRKAKFFSQSQGATSYSTRSPSHPGEYSELQGSSVLWQCYSHCLPEESGEASFWKSVTTLKRTKGPARHKSLFVSPANNLQSIKECYIILFKRLIL